MTPRKIRDGGCPQYQSEQVTGAFTDKEYTVESCLAKCEATTDCKVFIISKNNHKLCHLFKETAVKACSVSETSLYTIYSAEECLPGDESLLMHVILRLTTYFELHFSILYP